MILFIIILQACSTENGKNANAIDYQRYKTELTEIYILDQKFRLLTNSLEQIYEWDSDTIQEIYQLEHIQDSLNLKEVERIIKEIGWPNKSILGDSASDAAFLVLQHCQNVIIMEKYLPIMIEAANKNELSWSSLALFIDRIKMFKGEKQIYETQIIYDDSLQKLIPYPIENIVIIDSLRKDVGLTSFSDYLKGFGIKNEDQ